MSKNPKRASRRRRLADGPNEQEPPPGELPGGYAELDALYQELGPGLVRYLRRLLHSTHSERALICMFLAMLELVRLQAVLLYQPTQLGDILIKKADSFDQVFAEQERARDDWR